MKPISQNAPGCLRDFHMVGDDHSMELILACDTFFPFLQECKNIQDYRRAGARILLSYHSNLIGKIEIDSSHTHTHTQKCYLSKSCKVTTTAMLMYLITQCCMKIFRLFLSWSISFASEPVGASARRGISHVAKILSGMWPLWKLKPPCLGELFCIPLM